MEKKKGFSFEEKKTRKGFTLIELLVVMTIIAVLAGLALVSYQGARKTARDGKRKTDLEQIRSALEMCYSDDNSYPGVSFGNPLTCPGSGNTYLDSVPNDPVSGRQYSYSTDGVSYTLCASLETGSGSVPSGCGNCGTACNYKVTNP